MRQAFLSGCALATVLSLPALAVPPALQQAVNAPARTAEFVSRDGARHRVEELSFFGATPTSTVVEIWPGGGYWTQILAPLLHDRGIYHAALGTHDGDRTEAAYAMPATFKQMLDADPAVYGHVKLTMFGAHHPDLAPAGSADVVMTFRNLHNWMAAASSASRIIPPAP